MTNRFEFVSPSQSLCLEVPFCDMMFPCNFTSFIFVIGQLSVTTGKEVLPGKEKEEVKGGMEKQRGYLVQWHAEI